MAQRVKVKLGKWSAKEIALPDYRDLMIHPPAQSIILFGVCNTEKYNYRMAFGVGEVVRISHGEQFDLVYLVFGGGRKSMRKIIVNNNKARRSIYTLTVGHFATFYGYAKAKTFTNKKGETKAVWQMYAYCFQGWYIPKALEIKKLKQEKTDIVEMSQEELEVNENFIDMFKEEE